MPPKSPGQLRIVMAHEQSGGRISASLSSFLAFDRELTQQTSMLVQRWLYWASPDAALQPRGSVEK